MSLIFLSYRRTDSPQACRVYDWLSRRFGEDAVFMDVSDIPFAVEFPDFIRDSIVSSKTVIALIGPSWLGRINEPDDPVRMEIETALSNRVPILPLLIGNTPMPDPEAMPQAISTMASQNAFVVGVSRDFDTHMRALLPTIELALAALAKDSVVSADSRVIQLACRGLMDYLEDSYRSSGAGSSAVTWTVANAQELGSDGDRRVTLFLHRTTRLAEILELHIILSFWDASASGEQLLAGWVMRALERTPIIPNDFVSYSGTPLWEVKIRRSDEDAREVWRMITDQHLRLSLSYIVTVSPRDG